MAAETELMAMGLPLEAARAIGSSLAINQVTTSGQTGQANGFQLISNYTHFATVASGSACVMPPASGSSEMCIIIDPGAGNGIAIFPAVGDNFITSGGAIVAANGALTGGLGTGKVLTLYPCGTTWVANKTA